MITAMRTRKRAAYPAYKPSGVPWLGDVPEHWEVRRLKYTASINDEALPETTDPDYEFSYVDIGNVDAAKGIIATETYRFEAAPSRARRIVRDGDTIVSTVRTYLRAIAPIRDADGSLIVSTGFAVVRPRKLDSGFLSYALRAPSFVETIVSRSTGVSYPAINASEVGNIGVTLPPLDEQKAIAAFLDRETARIDALIEKKRRQIELLQEKRSALISHAITKGLNPNAPMRESGVEWLGKVPKHWDVKRLRQITPRLSVGLVINPSTYVDDNGEIPFFFGSDVREFALLPVKARRITHESSEKISGSRLHAGDIVTVRVGAPGVSAVVPADLDGANCASMMITRRSSAFDSRWLCYVFNSGWGRFQVDRVAYGAAQKQFNISHAREFVYPVPPLHEQRAMSEFLDHEYWRHDALIAKVEQSLAVLREHRTALISAAVTGRIDVRGEVRDG